MHRAFGITLWVLIVSCFCIPLLAQTERGTITGMVQDSTGAVVPGATMTANESCHRCLLDHPQCRIRNLHRGRPCRWAYTRFEPRKRASNSAGANRRHPERRFRSSRRFLLANRIDPTDRGGQGRRHSLEYGDRQRILHHQQRDGAGPADRRRRGSAQPPGSCLSNPRGQKLQYGELPMPPPPPERTLPTASRLAAVKPAPSGSPWTG